MGSPKQVSYLRVVHSAPRAEAPAPAEPVSPLATPRISSSDHGAIEEVNRHLSQAKRCQALRNFVWVGAHINNASRAAMHIHDQALRVEWEQRLVVFIRTSVELCEKSLKR